MVDCAFPPLGPTLVGAISFKAITIVEFDNEVFVLATLQAAMSIGTVLAVETVAENRPISGLCLY